jgi:hypothetical protein
MGAVFDKKQKQKREFVFVLQKRGGHFCKQKLKFVKHERRGNNSLLEEKSHVRLQQTPYGTILARLPYENR